MVEGISSTVTVFPLDAPSHNSHRTLYDIFVRFLISIEVNGSAGFPHASYTGANGQTFLCTLANGIGTYIALIYGPALWTIGLHAQGMREVKITPKWPLLASCCGFPGPDCLAIIQEDGHCTGDGVNRHQAHIPLIR